MHVTYKGPTSREDISTEFHIRDDSDDKRPLVRLVKDRPEPVSDALGALLTAEGDDRDARLKGHKFATATDEEVREAGLEPTTTSTAPAKAGGGGTTRAGART